MIFREIDFDKDKLIDYFGNKMQLFKERDPKKIITVNNYNFKSAELALPNIYKTIFNTGEDSISEIREKKDGYFEEQLTNIFEFSDITSDFIIKLKKENRPIVVKYVNDLNSIILDKSYTNRTKEIEQLTNNGIVKETVRLDDKGNILYKLPQGSVLEIKDNLDIVYVKVSTPGKSNENIVLPDFEKRMNSFIKSFDNNILSLTPNNNNPLNILTRESLQYNTNFVTYNLFRRVHNYSGYIPVEEAN
jgi:hypothetical protein